MRIRKKWFGVFLVALLQVPILGATHTPTLQDLYGIWEIDGEVVASSKGISKGHQKANDLAMGAKIEFREDYLIINGKQYNKPSYLCTTYPTLDDFLDENLEYDFQQTQGPILKVSFEEYTAYEVVNTHENRGTRYEYLDGYSMRDVMMVLDCSSILMVSLPP